MTSIDCVDIDSIEEPASKPNDSSSPHIHSSSCSHSTGPKMKKAGTLEIDLVERPALQKSATTEVTLDAYDHPNTPKSVNDGEAQRHGRLSRPLPNAM